VIRFGLPLYREADPSKGHGSPRGSHPDNHVLQAELTSARRVIEAARRSPQSRELFNALLTHDTLFPPVARQPDSTGAA
jgi:hypothetical protein